MTPEQRYEIATLVSDVEDRRLRYESFAMCNTFGLSAEQREKLSTDYHIAEAEFWAAEAKLQRAKLKAAIG